MKSTEALVISGRAWKTRSWIVESASWLVGEAGAQVRAVRGDVGEEVVVHHLVAVGLGHRGEPLVELQRREALRRAEGVDAREDGGAGALDIGGLHHLEARAVRAGGSAVDEE